MGEPQRHRLTPATLKVKYSFASTDEFIRNCCNDISLFGVFIKTKSPLKEGILLTLELQLKDGSPVIRGLAQVDWRREIAQSEDRPAGMAIKFIKLDDMSHQVVERAVEARNLACSVEAADSPESSASENESQPIPESGHTPRGIWATDVLASIDALSPLPDSPPPPNASSSEDKVPPKYSLTRVRTVYISDRPKPLGAPSAERSDRIETAEYSLNSAQPEASLTPTNEITSGPEASIDTISNAPSPAELFDVARTRLAPVPPKPTSNQNATSHCSDSVPVISSAKSNSIEHGYRDEPESISERINVSTLRERLAKKVASNPPRASSEPPTMHRWEHFADLSKAEIREYKHSGPLATLSKLLFHKR
jgi:uncharacterized protein (TIGR02266 family)